MSVSVKLSAAFLATVLLGGVLLWQLSVIRELAEGNRRLTTISARVSVVGTEQLYRIDRLAENYAKYRVTGDERYAEQFILLGRRVRTSFADLDTLALTTAEAGHIDRVERLLEEFGRLVPESPAGAGEPSTGGEVVEETERVEEWIDDLRSETVLLTEASRTAMLREADRSARNARRAETHAWLLGGLVILFGAVTTAAVARSVTLGLRRLQAGTKRVAEGEFDVRLSGAREREFRQLEAAFNAMVERLSELEQMQKDFLAGISHDLKSPLASIRETLSVLLDEVPGPLEERQRRLLSLASQSGERLAGMISRLLDLAQLEARAIPYAFAENDLADLARGVVSEMETRLRDRDVAVEVALPVELPADFDRDRMAQVVQNLLENALAVAPDGSTIRVEGGAASDGTVRLSVRDRGPGVPEGMREKIFDRFVRGDGRGSAGGAGLGLTICREIVNAHGGRIWVSEPEGGGSVFVVDLPPAAATAG